MSAIPDYASAPLIRTAFNVRIEKKPVSKAFYPMVETAESVQSFMPGWDAAVKKYELRRVVVTITGKCTYKAGTMDSTDIDVFAQLAPGNAPTMETATDTAWTYDQSLNWFGDNLSIADTPNHTAVSTETYKGYGAWELQQVEPDAGA